LHCRFERLKGFDGVSRLGSSLRRGNLTNHFSAMQRFLSRIYRHLTGYSHEQVLTRLLALDSFVPSVIYDIGAHRGNWTRSARKVLSSAEYVLFEANPDNAPALKLTGESFHIAALSAEEGRQRNFYLPRLSVTTGASFYREQTSHYSADNLRVLTVATRRLDVLARDQSISLPDLIKLDVQGAELDVLRGAGSLLKTCRAIIAELSFIQGNARAPRASEVIAGLAQMGFNAVDVCKIRRSSIGAVSQMDILFVDERLYAEYWKSAGLVP
jgi:FkbM family methyltransferase